MVDLATNSKIFGNAKYSTIFKRFKNGADKLILT
jgi:hypothetical protein